MTKDAARAILEKSEDLAAITDEEGVTWHYQIGDLFYEYPDCFGFADIHIKKAYGKSGVRIFHFPINFPSSLKTLT
jgi:hypothetical protein